MDLTTFKVRQIDVKRLEKNTQMSKYVRLRLKNITLKQVLWLRLTLD